MFLDVYQMAFFEVCMATSVIILRLKGKTLLLVNMIVKFYEIQIVKSANMARRNEIILSSSYLYAGQNQVLAYYYFFW